MSRKSYLYVSLALLVVGGLLAGSVSAASIPIINSSFESPSVNDGFSSNAFDWVIDHGSGLATWNIESDYFTGAGGDGTPSGADGKQTYYIISSAGVVDPQLGFLNSSSQVSETDTLLAGTYTLTAAVGRALEFEGTTVINATFVLFSLSTEDLGGISQSSTLATSIVPTGSVAPGTFEDRSLNFVVLPGNPRIGEKLRIDVGTANANLGRFGFIDNLRLDYSPGILGDFDGDFDVDGGDFLSWQRGESSNPLSQSDLADWEANFGTGGAPLSAASTAVPEPTSTLLILTASLAVYLRSVRRGVILPGMN